MSVSSRIRMQVVRSVAPEAEGSASTSTASTSAKLGSHTTGVADSGRWSTRRIAMYALFVALAMVTSFIEFPITPVTCNHCCCLRSHSAVCWQTFLKPVSKINRVLCR